MHGVNESAIANTTSYLAPVWNFWRYASYHILGHIQDYARLESISLKYQYSPLDRSDPESVIEHFVRDVMSPKRNEFSESQHCCDLGPRTYTAKEMKSLRSNSIYWRCVMDVFNNTATEWNRKNVIIFRLLNTSLGIGTESSTQFYSILLSLHLPGDRSNSTMLISLNISVQQAKTQEKIASREFFTPLNRKF